MYPRPAHGRERKGGDIGKKMVLLRPFFVKAKSRLQCLFHWHLQMEFMWAALHSLRVHYRMSHRGNPTILACDCPNFYTLHDVRKATVCPRLEPENQGCRDNPPSL